MKASPLRSQTKQACPLATFIQHSIGRSQTASDKRKEINLIQTEVKWSLFADDMILYMENPKTTTRNYYNSSMN